VVDGFVAGLHRSPDFGFSQEFAEYRAYAEGDDLRHVDWNGLKRVVNRYAGPAPTRHTSADSAFEPLSASQRLSPRLRVSASGPNSRTAEPLASKDPL
jgi:hypothetical protein